MAEITSNLNIKYPSKSIAQEVFDEMDHNEFQYTKTLDEFQNEESSDNEVDTSKIKALQAKLIDLSLTDNAISIQRKLWYMDFDLNNEDLMKALNIYDDAQKIEQKSENIIDMEYEKYLFQELLEGANDPFYKNNNCSFLYNENELYICISCPEIMEKIENPDGNYEYLPITIEMTLIA